MLRGKERSGESLSTAVSCEEGGLVDPAGRDNRCLEERQYDVAAAKDESTSPVESLEDSNCLK
jgi:hypothetical protein